jgi:hypothetical protein
MMTGKNWAVGVAVLVLCCAGQVKAAPILWSVASGGNGHWYELVTDAITWSEAKIAAEQKQYLGVSGHLVTLTSADENLFVYDNVYDRFLYEAAWIGLTDDEAYGGYESFGLPDFRVAGWVWVTGELVDFTAWGSFYRSSGEFVEEPNNDNGNEDYALMHRYISAGYAPWNDQTSYHTQPYIVEYDIEPNPIPEPSTLAIWGVLGGLGLIGARRRRKRSYDLSTPRQVLTRNFGK